MADSPETQKLERLKQWLLSSSDIQRIVFLAWLSHELTIHGRGFWLDLTGKEQAAAFHGLNELQHTISQNIGHLARGTNHISAENLWKILEHTAANYGLSPHLQRSLESLSSIHAPQIN